MDIVFFSGERFWEVLENGCNALVFRQRYRDAEGVVRANALRLYSGWLVGCGADRLEARQLRYLGWMLHDREGSVRACAADGIAAVLSVADEGATASKARPFVERFRARLASMIRDESSEASAAALRALRAALQHDGLLAEEDVTAVEEALAFGTGPEVRCEAARFVLDQAPEFGDEWVDGAAGRVAARRQLRAVVELASRAQAVVAAEVAETVVGVTRPHLDEEAEEEAMEPALAAVDGEETIADSIVAGMWGRRHAEALQDFGAWMDLLRTERNESQDAERDWLALDERALALAVAAAAARAARGQSKLGDDWTQEPDWTVTSEQVVERLQLAALEVPALVVATAEDRAAASALELATAAAENLPSTATYRRVVLDLAIAGTAALERAVSNDTMSAAARLLASLGSSTDSSARAERVRESMRAAASRLLAQVRDTTESMYEPERAVALRRLTELAIRAPVLAPADVDALLAIATERAEPRKLGTLIRTAIDNSKLPTPRVVSDICKIAVVALGWNIADARNSPSQHTMRALASSRDAIVKLCSSLLLQWTTVEVALAPRALLRTVQTAAETLERSSGLSDPETTKRLKGLGAYMSRLCASHRLVGVHTLTAVAQMLPATEKFRSELSWAAFEMPMALQAVFVAAVDLANSRLAASVALDCGEDYLARALAMTDEEEEEEEEEVFLDAEEARDETLQGSSRGARERRLVERAKRCLEDAMALSGFPAAPILLADCAVAAATRKALRASVVAAEAVSRAGSKRKSAAPSLSADEAAVLESHRDAAILRSMATLRRTHALILSRAAATAAAVGGRVAAAGPLGAMLAGQVYSRCVAGVPPMGVFVIGELEDEDVEDDGEEEVPNPFETVLATARAASHAGRIEPGAAATEEAQFARAGLRRLRASAPDAAAAAEWTLLAHWGALRSAACDAAAASAVLDAADAPPTASEKQAVLSDAEREAHLNAADELATAATLRLLELARRLASSLGVGGAAKDADLRAAVIRLLQRAVRMGISSISAPNIHTKDTNIRGLSSEARRRLNERRPRLSPLLEAVIPYMRLARANEIAAVVAKDMHACLKRQVDDEARALVTARAWDAAGEWQSAALFLAVAEGRASHTTHTVASTRHTNRSTTDNQSSRIAHRRPSSVHSESDWSQAPNETQPPTTKSSSSSSKKQPSSSSSSSNAASKKQRRARRVGAAAAGDIGEDAAEAIAASGTSSSSSSKRRRRS